MQAPITGNTFPVKEQLKAIGAKWDADQKCWTITASKIEEANKIVANAPPQAPVTPGVCRDCGKACKPPYTICWDCKSRRDRKAGICPRCKGQLDPWEKQHGMRLCANCRDGGGNARGGASYRDRNGNFVLGDDD